MSKPSSSRNRSIPSLIKSAYHVALEKMNPLMISFFSLLPVKKNLILFESEKDFTDNAQALYAWMNEHHQLDSLQVYWLADDPEALQKKIKHPTASKKKGHLRLKTDYLLARAEMLVFDHNNLLEHNPKARAREIYLSHGFGFKASKGQPANRRFFDDLMATSPMAARGMVRFWGEDVGKARILGYPRLDAFFVRDEDSIQKTRAFIHPEKYNGILVWMPTFRQSASRALSEDYLDNETGLPLFSSVASLEAFNNWLKERNVLMILKLHHLQAELEIFRKPFSNLLVVRDDDLLKNDLQLYPFLAALCAQNQPFAMITDYSSIGTDCLLMDRPLIYILDDYDQYARSRGIWPENARDYMPGDQVITIDGLETAIENILDGKDLHAEKRHAALHEVHAFQDGCSAKRISRYILSRTWLDPEKLAEVSVCRQGNGLSDQSE